MKILTFILLTFFLTKPSFAEDFISKEKAHHLVKKEKALLLDVRSLVEYKVKNIDGSKHISVSEVPKKLKDIEKLAGGKDKPIVVYCMSGGRSGKAMEILKKSGFKKVYNLGGIMRWY